ncbi:MAG TPA: CHAD domain-containing protein [Lentimicrobium sp.]|nr:CHAD domain-containing protein [Lentimicrobium sp.]
MNQRLNDYFRKQTETFNANFRKVRENYNTDAVHDMRVAIKRIRAVFRLLPILDPAFGKDLPVEAINRVFKLSGKIRDAQVQQLLLQKMEDRLETGFGEYAAYLKTTAAAAIQEFGRYAGGHQPEDVTAGLTGLVALTLAPFSGQQVRKAVTTLTDELKELAKKLKTDQEHDEHMHEIRRLLKQCNYLLSVFRRNDPQLPGLSRILEALEKANDTLGEWHDLVVGMEMLDRYMHKKTFERLNESERYHLLREAMNQRRHLLHARAVVMMDEAGF